MARIWEDPGHHLTGVHLTMHAFWGRTQREALKELTRWLKDQHPDMLIDEIRFDFDEPGDPDFGAQLYVTVTDWENND